MHQDNLMTPPQEQPAAASTAQSESTETKAFQDEQMQKRMSIGLSAERPTARAAPLRPPDKEESNRIQTWTLTGVVASLIVATLLLVSAKVVDSPTSWPWIVRSFAGGVAPSGLPENDAEGYLLLAGSDLNEPDTTLATEERPGAYVMGQVSDAGVYRMRLWPNNMAWSVLATNCSSPAYHIETEVVVAPESPSGFAGLVGRYQNDSTFYLFYVDGAGSYEVLLAQDGVWKSLQPRQVDSAINPAGIANDLSLKDDGEAMTFEVNGQVLYQTDSPALPSGSTGLAGRAGSTPVELNFDSYRLYAPPCVSDAAG
jgi:hypothetical protein